MIIFLTLFYKLLPLYVLIFLGFIAGKFLHVKKESISPLLIYIIAPIIVLNGVITTTINLANISVPVLIFLIASGICLSSYVLLKYVYHDSSRNILAFTAGAGNTGYFGIPVAMALFDKAQVSLVILSVLGIILYENTLGFLITARGSSSFKDSFVKLIKLPTVYAFLIGLVVNVSRWPVGQIYTENVSNFKGAYTILGMMLIGLGLASIKEFKFDIKFIGISFWTKFIVWPAVILLVIGIDMVTLNLYTNDIRKVLVLLSIVPLAANTVAYATELKAQPEKASLAVLLSTIFALFYIPLITTVFF